MSDAAAMVLLLSVFILLNVLYVLSLMYISLSRNEEENTYDTVKKEKKSHRKGIGTVQCSESGQDKLKSGSSKSRKKTCVFYDTFIYGSLEIGN